MIFMILLGISLFCIFNKTVISWVKNNFTSKPKPYYQQRHEFFEKLSREYYGVPDYTDELEAINRKFQLIEAGTEKVELIIPSLNSIERLKQRRTLLTIENELYTQVAEKNPQKSKNSLEIKDSKNLLEKADFLKGSTATLMISIVIISAIISLISYLLYRRKVKRSSWLWLPDENESIITDDRILLDFNHDTEEEKIKKQNSAHLKKEVNL